MTSSGQCAPNATATAVLPTAVGPTSTGTLAPAKPALQLFPRELHDGGAPVHIVWWQIGAEEPQEQLAHLPLAQPVSRFHRRATGVCGGEAFQPVGPPTESATCQISHHLPEAGPCVEARVRHGYGVHHHGAATEGLCLEAHAAELGAMRLERIELLIGQL